MSDTPYTYEAFLSDYAAMRHVLKYEHYTFHGETMQIPDNAPNRMQLQLGDYMMQHPEQKLNIGCFVMIMAYAARHAAELHLPSGDLDCTNQPATKPLIFRAIHQVSMTGPNQSPEYIRQLASTYEA